MTIRHSKVTRIAKDLSELESEFRVKNGRTGNTTDFQVTYRADPSGSAVASRFVFRPRWWLELELRLKDPSR